MVEAPTLAAWKTSTCPALPPRPRLSLPSAAWTGSDSFLARRGLGSIECGEGQLRLSGAECAAWACP